MLCYNELLCEANNKKRIEKIKITKGFSMNEKKEIAKNLASASVPVLFALSPIPSIWGTVACSLLTLANDCFQSAASLRSEKLREKLQEQMKRHEKEIEDNLQKNSNFASLFATIQRNDLEDIDEEKFDYYAISFINAITQEKLEYSKIHVFLNLLRDLTSKHLQMLKYLQNPVKNAQLPNKTQGYSERTLHDDLIIRSPWLSDDEELLNKITKDLYNNGLSKLEGIRFGQVRYNCSQNAQKRTTKLGDEFLAFITKRETKTV